MHRSFLSSLLVTGVVLSAACSSNTDDDADADGGGFGTVVDQDGDTITIKSGFVDRYQGSGGTRQYVVLTNMDDGCAALTWWAYREQQLSDLFFDDDPDFAEAIENTGDDLASEMSTDSPWWVGIDLSVDEGEEVEVLGARDGDDYDAGGIFWSTAIAMERPTYTSETTTGGSSLRTWGTTRYEADSFGGELNITVDDEGARGRIQAPYQTDELDTFDVDLAFDVPVCTDLLDAWDVD